MLTKTSSIFSRFIYTALLLTLGILPDFGMAQTYQKDTARINSLLKSAQTKRFTDTTSALSECQQAIDLARKYNDNYWLFQSYHRFGNIYKVNNKLKKAHVYFVETLNIASDLPDTIKKIIYSKAGSSYMAIGDVAKAYDYYLKNYELGLSTKNIGIKQLSCLELGVFYKEINEYEKATQYLMKSIELSVQMNNQNEICNSYRRLAAVYLRTKNYDLALQNSELSVSLVDKIDTIVLPRQYVFLSYGNVLKECGQFDKAIEIFNKALNLCRAIGDKTGQIDLLIALGDTYNKLNNLEKAAEYYKQCSAFMPSMADIELMTFQNSLGSIYIKKGEYDTAIFYLNQSLILSQKYEKRQLIENNYEQLSEAFDKKGDAVQSLFHLKKSVKLQDSIFSEENTKRIAEAQFKYNLVKSEEQIKAVKLRQGYTIGFGGLIVFLLLVGFLGYFLRTKVEKNKLLVEKNKEIWDKNRQLEESNELLVQFAHASAHDLKEPLRNIHSFTNLIEKKYVKSLPSEANEYMEFVTNGVQRMEHLLNGLLEFSSVLSMDKKESKQNDVVRILNKIFDKSEALIQSKNAKIAYPTQFPKILMGELHLEKVLNNVVNNALKFSEKPAKIDIDYTFKNEELILSIKDNGIGMDASYGDKIFKLFQKLNRTKDKESVGIGLTMTKNILDKYSCKIWFESVINEETTFYIAFPQSMVSEIPTNNMPLTLFEAKGVDAVLAI
jgi:signal transduction histidine kinase